MLEMIYSWSDWQTEERCRGRQEGNIEGRIISRVQLWKVWSRKEKQYQRLLEQGKKMPSVLEGIHECYIEMLESEDNVELLKFVQKYPHYSDEQLARRILWESEYWR